MKKLAKYVLLLGITSSANAESLDQDIYGFIYDKDGISVQVPSSGCTDKSYYKVEMMESFPAQLKFNRIKRDPCRMLLKNGVILNWSWKELNLNRATQMTVANEMKIITIP